jgi:hypothetical protein
VNKQKAEEQQNLKASKLQAQKEIKNERKSVNIFTKERQSLGTSAKAETAPKNIFTQERQSSNKVDLNSLDFKQLGGNQEPKKADVIMYVHKDSQPEKPVKQQVSQFNDSEL